MKFFNKNVLRDERVGGISDQSNTMQDVFNDHGSEDVEFEMTVASTDSDSDVVTHNLTADHSEGFTLSGVNFTGHDG